MARVQWLAMSAVVAACGSAGESRGGGTESATADTATPAASTVESSELRVSNVMIGRRVGTGNRITEPTFEFAPRDTVHLSVSTQGAGEGETLTAAWRSQAGEIIQQSEQPVAPAGENTAFHLSQPKGLKPGNYKVVLFLGQDSVDTKVFVVKR